jgi:hypothetical protein
MCLLCSRLLHVGHRRARKNKAIGVAKIPYHHVLATARHVGMNRAAGVGGIPCCHVQEGGRDEQNHQPFW